MCCPACVKLYRKALTNQCVLVMSLHDKNVFNRDGSPFVIKASRFTRARP